MDRYLKVTVSPNCAVGAVNSSSDTDSEEAKRPKSSTKRKYKQKYSQKWECLEEFSAWLMNVDGKSSCKLCNKTIAGGITHLQRHAKSASHIKLFEAARNTPKLEQMFVPDKTRKLLQNVKAAEVKLVMFIAEHHLPFSLLDHLSKLLPSICIDSEIAKKIECGRVKGTNLCVNAIAPINLQNVSNDLKNSYFSLIVDETTDISSKKSLAVVARYYKDSASQVVDKFLGLIEVNDCTAQSLYSSVKILLACNNIPQANMIGFAADNAAVMMGNRNGLQAKFRQDNPNIFVLGCVCHSFHLAASAACLKLPRCVEELARDICNYFAHSSKRLAELRECQVFVHLKPHKMLRMSQTRWLSLENVVNRILEQWQALILHFTAAAEEDNLINSKVILNALNNVVFKLYFNFLSYVLNLVNKLNLEFQSESPKIHLLNTRITELYRTLLRNFIKPDIINTNYSSYDNINVKNPENYLNLNVIYLGANFEMILKRNPTVDSSEIQNIRVRCLDFYIELCLQIKQRFSFDNPVLHFLKNLDPVVAASGEVPSISPIFDFFPMLVSSPEELNSEWRLLPDIEQLKLKARGDLAEFWSIVFNLKNGVGELMFPNLKVLVKGLLALPHSSATAERIFSQLNLMKTKTRNRLLVDTCSALLHTKELLNKEECYKFDVPLKLLNRNFSIYKSTNDETETENMIF